MNKSPNSNYKIRFNDCDMFGHLNNSRYLDYLINAREDHLKDYYSFDFTEYYKLTGTREPTDTPEWRVYPNPTHDFINIEFLQQDVITSVDFTISDASGKMYILSHFSGHTFQQDIRSLPSGIYFLNIKFNNKSTATKFIKI